MRDEFEQTIAVGYYGIMSYILLYEINYELLFLAGSTRLGNEVKYSLSLSHYVHCISNMLYQTVPYLYVLCIHRATWAST